MKMLILRALMATALLPGTALADGLTVETVTRPLSGYGKWVVHLNDADHKYQCQLKNLKKSGSEWVLECPEGNYRFTRSFSDRFKIVKEGETSGYINDAGYFIQTQLHEIRQASKNKRNQWLLQGSSSVLSASFSDLKEWRAYFFNLDGVKEGEMVMSWPFSDLKELRVEDGFPTANEEQKRDKLLALFATIYSSVMSRH